MRKLTMWLRNNLNATMQLRLTALAIAVFAFGRFAAAAVIHVDASVTAPGGPGTSWSNAFASLQGALDYASSGDEIWVAAGTYKPTEPVDANNEMQTNSFHAVDAAARTKTFRLVKNVGLYGGFGGNAQGGGETDRSQADPANNLTILSGDINGDDGRNEYDDNVYHVLLYAQPSSDNEYPCPAQFVVDGFVITGGVANGGSDERDRGGDEGDLNTIGGGALVVYDEVAHQLETPAGPHFRRCAFVNNAAKFGGGGLASRFGGVRVTDCTFEANAQTAMSGKVVAEMRCGGGAINVVGPVVILKSRFLSNTSTAGGAIQHSASAGDADRRVLLISECEFIEDEAPAPDA